MEYNFYVHKGKLNKIQYDYNLNNQDFFNRYGIRKMHSKTQIGEDDNGRYASYYDDLWDLAPISGVGEIVDAVSSDVPFEFYSRDYYPLNNKEIKQKKRNEEKLNSYLEYLKEKKFK